MRSWWDFLGRYWSCCRIPFVGRPFKGSLYYEWQIGPLVVMWQHNMNHKPFDPHRAGRGHMWIDSEWIYNMRWGLPRRRL